MPFKYRNLNKISITMININMQSAPVVDQSRFLVNTSLAIGKSFQSMENKIEKLNKKLDQLKGDCSQKEK